MNSTRTLLTEAVCMNDCATSQARLPSARAERAPRTGMYAAEQARGNTDGSLDRHGPVHRRAALLALRAFAGHHRGAGMAVARRHAAPRARSAARQSRGLDAVAVRDTVRAMSMRTTSSRTASTRASTGMTWTSHGAVARRNGWSHSVSSSHHPVTREVHPERICAGRPLRVVAYRRSCCAACNRHIGAHHAALLGHFPIITPDGVVLVQARVCHRCLTPPAKARGLAATILHNIGAWYARQALPAQDIEIAAVLPAAWWRTDVGIRHPERLAAHLLRVSITPGRRKPPPSLSELCLGGLGQGLADIALDVFARCHRYTYQYGPCVRRHRASTAGSMDYRNSPTPGRTTRRLPVHVACLGRSPFSLMCCHRESQRV